MNIAIDGPAGAGKSTIAKILAKELGFIYVDTGAMYRCMTLFYIRQGISADDSASIEKYVDEIDVGLKYIDGIQHVYLNGEDVSGFIRTEEVSAMTSAVAVYPIVRAKLLDLQRNLAASNDVIMDGRDIGTYVLPNAELKIYLTASVDSRALRRYKELIEKGEDVNLDDIKSEIAQRDERDMNRETAPLKQAEDAVYLDTSDMTIDEVVACIKELSERD